MRQDPILGRRRPTPAIYPDILIVGIGGCGITDIVEMAGQLNGIHCLAVDSAALPSPGLAGFNFMHLPVDPAHAGGAGGSVERGQRAVEAGRERLAAIIERHDLVFVVGGLGGGTGSALAVLLGQLAHERGIPCFGLFTLPNAFEGAYRERNATAALRDCRPYYDAISLYSNDHLDRTPRRPFHDASRRKLEAVTTILAMVTTVLPVNLDLADIRATYKAGDAIQACSFKLDGLAALGRLPTSPEALPYMTATSRPSRALVRIALGPRRIMERLRRIEGHLSATFLHGIDISWSVLQAPDLGRRIEVSIILGGNRTDLITEPE